MKSLKFIVLLILISSCGGGGGGGDASVPFAITLAPNSISVDEDNIFNGSFAARANESVTLTYSVTSGTSNGQINISSSSGSVTYTPNSNFNGEDSFTYSVTASEKSVTQTSTVTITVNPINDPPSISIVSNNELDENSILFDQNPSFSVTYSDVDNSDEELSFSAKINGQDVPSTFTASGSGSGDITLDLTSLTSAGLFDAEIIVSDGSLTGVDTYTTWHISNKTVVTISQDDDPEDGYDGGAKTQKDYYVYYLIGNPQSIGRTKYLFIGDSLDGNTDISLYRRALIASVNKLNASDASEFFGEDYFTVVSAEPVDPDGTSPVGVRTGCYDFDEDIYCISELDEAIFDVMLPDNVLVSILTKAVNPDSGLGRGVNQGYKNIQRIRDTDPERTRHTLMHELGHAHGYMGDEYRTDERDLTDRGYNVNTTTQSDLSILKWNHHIPDQLNVLGKDIQVCYNYGDGTIADWDDLGINIADCDCFINEWRTSTDSNGNNSYTFVRKNPECSGVGLFEGNYYGLYDNYRPTFCSVMDRCTSAGYGPVNVEGFAVGSIQNQGFYDNDDVRLVKDAGQANVGFEIALDVEYDTSKITLKWFKNGVEDTSKQNQKTVIFDRPTDNSVEIYTAKAVDLTGTITASDDVLDNTDFYEGAFQSYFYWCEYDSNNRCSWSYDPDPSTYSQFNYGYMRGPMGVTWGINWEKW
ncbi:Ig-like domain-containing protein [Gammaproteobacteria bacterium]|nr:Ig-like domain-containing protein [Gammaproteobacteria bacterium]